MTTTAPDLESRVAALEAEMARLKEELDDTQAEIAIQQGLEEMERGEGVPAIEAVRALGRKYNLESQ